MFFLSCVSPLWALGDAEQSENDGASGMFDFDITLDLSSAVIPDSVDEPLFRIGGFIKQESAFAYKLDADPWRKIRSIINMKSDARIFEEWKGKFSVNGFYDYAFQYNGREKYTDETLEVYEREIDIRDLYVGGPVAPWLTVRLGRQIMAWGESDFFQITDIANPRDLREPAMADLEDIRMPVAATRINVFVDEWEVNLTVIHEPRPNKTGPEGSDFDPYSNLRSETMEINEDDSPEPSFSNMEFIGRVFRTFHGGDFSLIAGETFDDQAYLKLTEYSVINGQPHIQLTPRHKTMQTIGTAGNVITGPLLWKFETAFYFNRAFSRDDLERQIMMDPTSSQYETWSERNSIHAMVGFEYTGIEDLRITIEGAVEHIRRYDESLWVPQNSDVYYALADYNMAHETMNLKIQYGFYNKSNCHILKVGFGYDPMDALSIEIGAIVYSADDANSLIYAFREQDRLYMGVKYSF